MNNSWETYCMRFYFFSLTNNIGKHAGKKWVTKDNSGAESNIHKHYFGVAAFHKNK